MRSLFIQGTLLAAFIIILVSPDTMEAQQIMPPLGVPDDATYFRGKWYKLYLKSMSWPNARRRCERLGGQLAIIPNEPTWDYLKEMSEGLTLWLGASDKETEGRWKWVDGTRMTIKHWYPGQPDNAWAKEHYLTFYKNHLNDALIDHSENRKAKVVGFVCEWKAKAPTPTYLPVPEVRKSANIQNRDLIARWTFDNHQSLENLKVIGDVIRTEPDGTKYLSTGVERYVEIPNRKEFDLLHPFTVALWFRNDSPAPQLSYASVVSKGNHAWQLRFSADRKRLVFVLGIGGKHRQVDIPASKFKANQWYHVAAVYTGKDLLFYINGNLESQMIGSGPIPYRSRRSGITLGNSADAKKNILPAVSMT